MLNEPWVSIAAGDLSDLGFTLLNSDRPAAPGGSQLLVALRDQPSLRHFDPERITCWVAAAERGRALTIDRKSPPGVRTILWGHLHVVDRLAVENRFLTFGGQLVVADVGNGLRLVKLVSPGPIVRWGGHSQGVDPLAAEIGAFFGRLIVPVDYRPGAEAQLAATTAECLYAAFLVDQGGPHRAPRVDDRDPLDRWLRAEATRVRTHDPDSWSAGERLLRDLGLPAA
jgi:hypothetical protein